MITEFLRELSELSNKHGVVIAGCGCCGSPFITEWKAKGKYSVDEGENNLEWEEVDERDC